MFNFSEIIGQERIIRTMQNDIRYDKISHSYIILGENSVTWELANAFSKAILCDEKRIEPCDVCFSCHAANIGNHPDILSVAATKTKSIGVTDVREQLVVPSAIKPYRSDYKIFIIPNADTMTTEAQNAILKSIEEPNGYCVFILLAKNSNLFLSTILSRCILLKALPLSQENLVEYLTKKNIPSDTAYAYATYAEGSIEKAEKLLESESFSNLREQVIELISTIHKKDDMAVFNEAKKLEGLKDQLPNILNIVYLWLRDILLAKRKDTTNFICNKDKKNILVQLAKEISYKKIYHGISGVLEAEQQLARNANTLLTLEIMLLNFAAHEADL